MLDVSQSHGLTGFRDVRPCGTGATSRVYRAMAVDSGRVVALKRMNRHLVRGVDSLARFRRELDALRKVQHPGICRVHEVIDWDGDPTLVMDYIEGADLHELVATGGPLDGEVATRITRELLDILAAAHGAGIVHRDVKPQNVRVRPDGGVMLLDFGSARLDAASKLTTTGTSVGTPEYMPPELFAGSAYDPRVDIYGVGATVFFALTGKAPHTAESLAELASLRNTTDAPPVAEVAPAASTALAQALDRCLARDPSRRYATAALATWALDHPEMERELSLRRSRQPPCLHCHARIAPESAVCPQCKSTHPFGFSPGLHHVDITSVAEPSRFVEHVVAEFPEHGTPEGVAALTERIAALSFEHQRYVSFIDRDQAEAVVSRLSDHGVRAELVHERSVLGRSVLSGLIAGIFGLVWFLFMELGLRGFPHPSLTDLVFALPGFVVGYLVSVFASLRRAGGGILAAAAKGAAARATITALLAIATVAALMWFHLLVRALLRGWAYPDLELAQTIASASVATAALGAAAFASSRARLGAEQRKPSPEAPFLMRLQRALVPSQRATARVSTTRRTLALVVGAVGLVVVEWIGVGSIINISQRAAARTFPVDTLHRLPWQFRRFAIDREVPFPKFDDLPPVEPNVWLGFWESIAASIEAPFSMLTAVAAVLVAGLGIRLVRRRRRSLRADGTRILAELEPATQTAAGTRSPPRTRDAPIRHGAAEEVAGLAGADGFARDAVWRAADLSHLLEPESSQRLAAAIVALGSRKNDAQVRERSLLARSILETDQGQRTRFDFLELEGELEAEAAETWWEQRRRL